MNDSNKYLIIIPAFNEEMNISKVLKKVKQVTSSLPVDMIVVDDGSTDKTAELALQEHTKIIRLSTNLGYGGAVQTGFKFAANRDYDYVILFDADGQHDAMYIKELIDYIETTGCDIVIGSRYLNKFSCKFADLKRIGIGFFSWIASFLLKRRITDATSGFQIVSRKVFSYLAAGNNYPQEYPDADLLIILGKLGYTIKEYPVLMHEREQGLSMHRGIVRPITYTIRMLISILCTF